MSTEIAMSDTETVVEHERPAKPMRVEAGQRWRWNLEALSEPANPNPFEVVKVDGDFVTVSSVDRDDPTHPICYVTDDFLILREAVYLGPSTPMPETGKAPAPAKGQRWRDTDDRDGWKFRNGKPFTLERRYPHDPTLGWCHTPGSDSYWPDYCFTNGRLAFVDHGEPASPPSQPRTGPVVMENCTVAAPQGRAPEVPRSVAPTLAQWKPRSTDTTPPAPLTARAILQSRERARQAKRDADARAVAAFCDDFDLLPDAP